MLYIVAFLLAATAPPPPLQPYLAGINVSNIDKAAAWYSDTLGFTVTKAPSQPAPGVRFAVLQNGDFRVELIELAGSRPRNADDKQQGFFKIAFRVADVDGLVAALRAKGVRITHAPYDDAALGVRSFVAADPDGNALQFFQPLRDPAEEVRAAETAFAKAFADRDVAKFASFLSDDARFMSPSRTLSGKAEVMAVWSEYMKNPQFSWRPERVTANAAGDLGLSAGPVFDAKGKHILNYVSTWQKQGGTWKVVFDGPGAAVCD